jgi:general secretion pathway protein J
MDRLVKYADLLVWVLDPQKYADAALHDRYIRPMASYSDVTLVPASSWQLYFFRDNTWVPASQLPTVAATPNAPTGPVVAMPDGLRLVITLPPGDGLSGTLTRDWVRPTVGAPRSS